MQSDLLKQTLKLWMASRLIEKPWRICSDETLGLNVIEDSNSPWCGVVPVTPLMDTQLDQIVIKSILIPLRHEVLKRLQQKILKHSRRDWFEIFATIFILLNNIEIATAHDHEFAVFYGHFVSLNKFIRGEGSFYLDTWPWYEV
jgi:hypothetical protein